MDASRLQVGDLVVDLRYRRVIRPDGQSELPQRMFDLLQLFLEEPHVLHGRADLFRRLWPGVVVEDANLSQSVWMLRKALGPQRRHWIRTVSKSGYVFEPPTAIVPLAATGAGNAPEGRVATATPRTPVDRAAADGDAPGATRPAEVSRRRGQAAPRIPRMAAGLVLAGALCAGLVGLAWRGGPEGGTAAVAATAPAEVALIGVGDDAAPADDTWPARLLHAWLAWKLDLSPGVVRLSEAHLASGTVAGTPHLVLVSSGTVAGTGDMFIRARVGHGAQSRQFERRGPPGEMPALVDALSQAVVDAVAPASAAGAWGPLDISPDAARTYADAYDAYEARAWPAAADQLASVVRHAPGFPPARLQLADARMRMGQSLAARDQVDAMEAVPGQVPEAARPVLAAQLLALDPRRTLSAAEAFGTLSADYPHRHDFALRMAALLADAGRSQEALDVLARPVWRRQPSAVRIEHYLATAQGHFGLGDLERAREAAVGALRLAREAGPGWAREHGQVLLALAQVDQALRGEQADASLFEQAARQFELAGSPVNAMFARYVGGTYVDPAEADGDVLETLLAEARAGGYLGIEIDLLRNAALAHYMAGRHDRYRARLEEAVTVATKAENPLWLEQLGLDLLADDVLAADLRSADERIRQLRDGALQGEGAVQVEEYAAFLAATRGEFGRAMALLDGAARGPDVPRLTVARLACARADLHAQQGRLAKARESLRTCGAPDLPEHRDMVALGTAWIDLLAGDRAAALAHLEPLGERTDVADGPDAWWTTLQLGYLWSRAGAPARAEPLFRAAREPARAAGYRWMVALADVGLAETRTARGDWDAAQAHLDAARAHTPEDAWLLTSRIEQAAAAVELGRGDADAAHARLRAVHAAAHARGDVVAQVETHALLPREGDDRPCARDGLLASRGLRGASLDWLFDAASRVRAPLAQAEVALPD
ncbi:hypothetical protein GCM10028862_11540 [Luteimonas pelagia]